MSEDPSVRIDQYIAGFADWRGDLMARLRELITQAHPSLTEEWKWDIPVWTSAGNVCAIGGFKESVKVNFFKGASLPDPDGLFNGGLEAKASRSIDFRKGDAVNGSALQELIRAAVAQNSGKR
jgi:hypothetical protein